MSRARAPPAAVVATHAVTHARTHGRGRVHTHGHTHIDSNVPIQEIRVQSTNREYTPHTHTHADVHTQI